MLTVKSFNVYNVLTVNIGKRIVDWYLIFKVFHLSGIILFLGNIIISGWWKAMADRQGDPLVIAFAQHQVTLTDWVFTLGGVVLLIIGGQGMSNIASYDNVSWIFWGWVLFGASGVIWALILIPLQFKLAKITKEFQRGIDIPEQYWRLSKQWYAWGVIATVLPLINLYVMIFRFGGEV